MDETEEIFELPAKNPRIRASLLSVIFFRYTITALYA